MNTPNNINNQLDLPQLIGKTKSSRKIGFKLLNKIKKNLDEEFDLDNSKTKIYKSAKIFPEISFNCSTPELKPRPPINFTNIPSSPKKKFNVPKLNLSQKDLDVLKTRLFEDNEPNFPITPRIADKTIYTPKAPVKNKNYKNAKNTQELFLDDIEDLIYSDDCSIDSGLDNFENVKRQLVF